MSLNELFTSIANAIRDKKGTTSPIVAENFPTEIESITSGGGTDTSDATATSGDILLNKTAYAKGSKLIGTIANNGALNYTPTTSQQTIPTGYTSGGTIAAVTSAIDNNIVQSNIKSGVTILGVTGNLEPDKPDQTKTATPTTSEQTIEPDNGYELASVTVNAVTSSIDNNIQANNIKKDVSILGVTGTYEGSGGSSLDIKDVNLYDYDGTLLHSYTKTEFLALSALPSNPTHDGLTAQGWNWTLADAKTYVTSYGFLNIGQIYTTTSGSCEFDIELTESTGLTATLNMIGTKNWGDGTTDTDTSHTYSNTGKYTITCNGTALKSYLFGQLPASSDYTVVNVRLAGIYRYIYVCILQL